MTWDELSDLLSGISEDTPLAKVVLIRTETDRERIKSMTPGQRRMRSEWQRRRASQVAPQRLGEFLSVMQGALRGAFGEV